MFLREDLLSNLPDEILISILSLLKLKEAIRTSVMCSRWRHLWKFTSRLNFDDSLFLSETPIGVAFDLVNNVLKLHNQGTKIIEEFTVRFYGKTDRSEMDITNWLNFALKKRVQKLQLDFPIRKTRYTLTKMFLHSHEFGSMTVLHLKGVQVSGQVVEHLLSHCPFLEVLSLGGSLCLGHLKIYGPSLNLKRLEIVNCIWLECIELSATSLVSVKYHADIPSEGIFVSHLPNLVEASFNDGFALYLTRNLPRFSSNLSQLETLELDFHLIWVSERQIKYPKFRNLKNLDLTVTTSKAQDLLCCISFLKVSPLLRRLRLKVVDVELEAFGVGFEVSPKMQGRKVELHHCLKVVELSGNTCLKFYVKLAKHLLKRAVTLEKLVIELPCSNGRQKGWVNPKIKLAVHSKLKASLPPGAELVIL